MSDLVREPHSVPPPPADVIAAEDHAPLNTVAHSGARVSSAAIARSLRLSIVDGSMHAVMVGVSEAYISAFAVQLGHRDVALALLTTVPMFVGALGQLFTAGFVRVLGSRQRVVVVSALMQAVSHVLLCAIAWQRATSFAPLMLATLTFWGFGLVQAPAWNSWMGALTRHVPREHYFAQRSATVTAVLLFAFSFAGLVLSRAQAQGTQLSTFAWLFALALAARTLSATLLALKIDPDPITPRSDTTWMRAKLALSKGRFRVALFVACMMFGAHFSVPFFTPYMLRTLQLTLGQFALLTAVAIASKAASFSLWRALSARWSRPRDGADLGADGMLAVLLLCACVMALLPVQWVWWSSVPALIVVQLVSGAAWGGFEYASLQLLLRDAPEGGEVEFFSLASSGSSALQVIGGLLGSVVLAWFSDGAREISASGYHGAFIASSLLRGVALLLIAPLVIASYRVRAQSISVGVQKASG